MNDTIDITGLDKAEILAALYNGSHVQGMGVFQAKPGRMSVDDARNMLETTKSFDYVHGKVMKISFNSPDNEFWVDLYNRDNGYGAAQRIIEQIRKAKRWTKKRKET